jgi:elongation factor G
MDRANIHVLDILNKLKAVFSRLLVAHQYPILQRKYLIGFIDLVSEKAYGHIVTIA